MALEARNVFFRYEKQQMSRLAGHPDGQPWILEDCTLKLERGECLAVSAPSGYGKTTLAMLLSGYLQPVKGQILADERPLPGRGICPVQLICQHPEQAVNPRWRLCRVLAESGSLNTDLLDALGIERPWLDRFPRELSGGELQRFCVARALQSGARYLICDEISTMLDVITQAQIWKVVLEEAAKQGMGILAITHNQHLAKRISTRMIDLRSLSC